MEDYHKYGIQFEKLIHKYVETENKNFSYGDGLSFTRREIHTINAIGENRDINVTSLAELQGITKGAVSQMIRKLAAKGLVEKAPSPLSEAEVLLRLTEPGKTAFEKHKQYHREVQDDFFRYLENLPPESFALLLDFMDHFEKMLDRKKNYR